MEPYDSILKEILIADKDFEKALENLDYFSVNKHPLDPNKQRFVAVLKDGTQVDFCSD